MARSKNEFQTIHSEGGLLPPDLLRRVVDPKASLPGTKPEDYGLPQGERLNEAITQSWNRMRRHWAEFRTAAGNLPENEAGTGLTNDKWSVPLLRELGFGLLPTSAGPEIDGRTYAINRFFGSTAVHLIGCGLSLDRRAAGVRGAAATNPHGLVQEFLNRSQGHLWAIVSNGLRFRVLRDNQALSRQSYLEFDLEAMFSGEVFSDFVLLWLMAHATRFAPQGDGPAETCWLEQWTKVAAEEGTRALGDLRAGVEKALQILGEAFVSHPRNSALREALRGEELTLSDFHGQLLRLVYRLIFLFVAEDRTLDGISLLHPRDDSEAGRQARDRFDTNYSTARLRELAAKIKGSRHGDFWQQFNFLVGALSGDDRFSAVRQNLALPALGSFLWNPDSTTALNASYLHSGDGVELANADFLEALRHLAYTRQGKVLRPVDYKNLGAEELGGVYETLLALTPQISGDGNRFTFAEFAGNERKTSGSYYTPDSLVQCLLDSALNPVVDEAIKGKVGAEAEQAILSLKVCDPAVGSGHFLVGAAHRLARHLARVRANLQGESEPSPLLYQHALRDVISRCLYGVDINPMSAELCRVNLWLEALEPGKPLSFLDHHIQVGNSLLGTTPALLAKGIPDDAFTAIEGDVKTRVTQLKKQNKRERPDAESGKRQLYLEEDRSALRNIAADFGRLNTAPDSTLAEVSALQEQYSRLIGSSEYESTRLLADTWCGAFVWKKDDSDMGKLCPTERDFRKVELHAAAGLLPHVHDEIERLREQYQFFHWHLAFPDVFRLPGKDEMPKNEQTGWSGGFDVVLGNPPWERIKLEEQEWFAERRPDIAHARNAAVRRRMIEELRAGDPVMFAAFLADRRKAEGQSHVIRNSSSYNEKSGERSGMFPLCGRGDVNTYSIFAELNRLLISSNGRVGCIVPSGVATDDTTKLFFQNLVETKSLVSLFDFENRELVFPAVAPVMKFCLLTTGSPLCPTAETATFVFFAARTEDLADEHRRFTLSANDIALLNPNTRTCATFRSRNDAELNKAIYRRAVALIDKRFESGNRWNVKLFAMFHMTNDAEHFRARNQLEHDHFTLHGSRFIRGSEVYEPLYEAKLVQQFDHRHGTFDGLSGESVFNTKAATNIPTEVQLAEADFAIVPRYWVLHEVVEATLSKVWTRRWSLVFRDIIQAMTNARCGVFTVIPRSAVSNKLPLILPRIDDCRLIPAFAAALNSFVFDYCVRQKIGGTSLNFFILEQLPVLPPDTYAQRCQWASAHSSIPTGSSLSDWLLLRVLELTYAAWDLEPFARDCGCTGPPFRWDEERRFLLRAELDAAFFHLYLRADENGDWVPASKADGCPHDESPEDIARLKASFPKPRDAVSYIMDTFPIVRRKDEEKHNGDYRTKRVILETYDAMQESIRTRQPYQTRLDPPPGPPADPLSHWPPGTARPANWPAHIHPPKENVT